MHRLRRFLRRDDGSVSLWVVLSMVAFIIVLGLGIDGGGQVAAHQQAQQVAASAARAGTGAAGTSDNANPDPSTIDRFRAVAAAQGYLTAAGYTGTATFNNGQVTVTIDHDYDTVFLTYIGIGQLPANATATSELIEGANP